MAPHEAIICQATGKTFSESVCFGLRVEGPPPLSIDLPPPLRGWAQSEGPPSLFVTAPAEQFASTHGIALCRPGDQSWGVDSTELKATATCVPAMFIDTSAGIIPRKAKRRGCPIVAKS